MVVVVAAADSTVVCWLLNKKMASKCLLMLSEWDFQIKIIKKY
jgi:hypothetical protein